MMIRERERGHFFQFRWNCGSHTSHPTPFEDIISRHVLHHHCVVSHEEKSDCCQKQSRAHEDGDSPNDLSIVIVENHFKSQKVLTKRERQCHLIHNMFMRTIRSDAILPSSSGTISTIRIVMNRFCRRDPSRENSQEDPELVLKTCFNVAVAIHFIWNRVERSSCASQSSWYDFTQSLLRELKGSYTLTHSKKKRSLTRSNVLEFRNADPYAVFVREVSRISRSQSRRFFLSPSLELRRRLNHHTTRLFTKTRTPTLEHRYDDLIFHKRSNRQGGPRRECSTRLSLSRSPSPLNDSCRSLLRLAMIWEQICHVAFLWDLVGVFWHRTHLLTKTDPVCVVKNFTSIL